jgi:hypothetical protein
LYSHKELYGAIWGLDLFPDNGSTGILTVGSDGTLCASNLFLHGKKTDWKKHTELFRICSVDHVSSKELRTDNGTSSSSSSNYGVLDSGAGHLLFAQDHWRQRQGVRGTHVSFDEDRSFIGADQHQQFQYSREHMNEGISSDLPRIHIERNKPTSYADSKKATELVLSSRGIPLHSVSSVLLSDLIVAAPIPAGIISPSTAGTAGVDSMASSASSEILVDGIAADRRAGADEASTQSVKRKDKMGGQDVVIACAGAAGMLRITIVNVFSELYSKA